MPMTVSAASSVAEAAESRTVALRKSPKRKGSDQEGAQELSHAVRAVDHRVGLVLELGGRLVRAHADAHRVLEPPPLLQLREAAEGVEVGHVVADVDRRGEVSVLQQAD